MSGGARKSVSQIAVKAIKEKGCNRKARFVITLPFGVTREFISKCKKAGFIDSPKHTQAGLLYLKMGTVILTGALCVKRVSATCSDESDCENKINSVVKLLNGIV